MRCNFYNFSPIALREWSLTELAKEKSLNISHTKRLINTLTEYGYLEKDPISKRYRLGLSIVRLSGVLTSTMEIYKEARPILSKLWKSMMKTFTSES